MQHFTFQRDVYISTRLCHNFQGSISIKLMTSELFLEEPRKAPDNLLKANSRLRLIEIFRDKQLTITTTERDVIRTRTARCALMLSNKIHYGSHQASWRTDCASHMLSSKKKFFSLHKEDASRDTLGRNWYKWQDWTLETRPCHLKSLGNIQRGVYPEGETNFLRSRNFEWKSVAKTLKSFCLQFHFKKSRIFPSFNSFFFPIGWSMNETFQAEGKL